MIDLVTIKVYAGTGGNGAVSFYKLLNMKYGKADGGNGGNGGSIFLESDPGVFDLEQYRGRGSIKAENGTNGGNSQKRGKDAPDVIIKVPVGTVVKLKGKTELDFDLNTPGQKILVAKGGGGGRGNASYRGIRDRKGKKPEHWQIFNRSQKGWRGEETDLILELKTIAQVGLIGLPNAGKSTLLSKLTNAKPRIAPYPFTTLEPNIGVMIFNEKTQAGVTRIILADIPGLVEGAYLGKGLGDQFLRHIERTNILVHVIDGTSDDITRDYEIVRNELKLYGRGLDQKKELIVINKIDLLSDGQIKIIQKLFKQKKKVLISADRGIGVEELVKLIAGSL